MEFTLEFIRMFSIALHSASHSFEQTHDVKKFVEQTDK